MMTRILISGYRKFSQKCLNDRAISNFCQYIRIKTDHPQPDYHKAVDFLKIQAGQLNLNFNTFELAVDNPIVFITWKGSNPNLKSVLFNSHTDVVPAVPDLWKYEPFSAHINDNGDIFGRGTQDMKSIGIQYLEAIRRIKFENPTYQPTRDIHVLFVPDEEQGGLKGMEPLVETEFFEQLNVGMMMDEGLPSPTDTFSVYYGERSVWWITLSIEGQAGHASQFIDNCAAVKMTKLLNKCIEFHEREKARLKRNNLTLGEVTTVNITGIRGGSQHNVIPSQLSVDLDIRISPPDEYHKFKETFYQWIDEVGGGIKIVTAHDTGTPKLTDISDANPWWRTFQSVCRDRNMKINPQIFSASCDSRLIRNMGISAIGISPMLHTQMLLHDHNEYLNKDEFLRGISFYQHLIPALADQLEEEEEQKQK